MNQQELEIALARFRQVLLDWPMGITVWHRASSEKGIITGCQLCGDGMSMPVIQWGANRSGLCYPVELSKSLVSPGEGEDWKTVTP